MGSLDAQGVAAMHGFHHSSPDHGDGSGCYVSQGYNPFAAGCEWDMKHGHHLAPGCRAFDQGYPVARSVEADRRPAPSGGYNPFAEDCAFEDEVGPQQQFGEFEQHVIHPQQGSSLDYMHQCYGHQFVHQAAAYSRHPYDLPPIVPAPETGIFSFRQPGPKPHRLLWLSEEEAEIIRLIRMSQMKEGFCCSAASASEEQMSPAHSPVMAANIRRSSNRHGTVCTPRRSRLPLEEFSLPPSAQSMKEPIGTGRSLQDDKQWIALHRQKTKDVAASRRVFAALRIQRAWRRYHTRLQRRKLGLGSKNPVKRSLSAQEAARVVQRVWRARRKHTKKAMPAKALPKTLKELYGVIKSRHAAKGLSPPTYAKFVKLIGRIHAATEGARVRRRIKSRRLKAVIKEIKEIRAVMEDMSRDTGPEASTGLLPQLSAQLRQKLTQLHTALQGPGDTARYLLRRGPATPLVIVGGSRSTSPSRTGDQAQIRVLGSSQSESGIPSLRCSLFTVNNLGASTETLTSRDSDGIQPRKPRTSTDTEFQDHRRAARRPPSQELERKKETGARSKADQIPGLGESSASEPPTSTSRQNVQPESSYPRQSQLLQDQRSESGIGSVRSSNFEHGTDDTDQQAEQNKPKRPFLRRKSAAVPPQKLDWSQVKPMVSSRLEPGLKSKLQKNRVRENASKASSKKTNYNNVRSRLFKYQATSAEECTLPEDSTSRQGNGYAELHTQVDMTSKTSSWRPSSGTLTEEITQELTTQNFSYYEGNAEDDMVNQHSITPRQASSVSSPSKSGSYAYRYAKSRSRCSDAQWQSALEKMDKTSERNYSFRYPEGTEAGPEAPNAAERPSSPETASYASPELETTFKHIMSLKQESKVTLHNLFGFQQGRTIIPRLSPDSRIFHGSFSEKRRLHEQLIQEGHASQLHHDTLAFVSTRD